MLGTKKVFILLQYRADCIVKCGQPFRVWHSYCSIDTRTKQMSNMEKFRPFAKPTEADFFSIETRDGQRFIRVYGYSYESSSMDYVSDENPDGTYWAMTDVSGFEVPLAEFIAEYQENGADYSDEIYEECDQYQDDQTDEQAVQTLNRYFNGHGADAFLSFGEVRLDTPDGNYIQINRMYDDTLTGYEDWREGEAYNEAMNGCHHIEQLFGVCEAQEDYTPDTKARMDRIRELARELMTQMKTWYRQDILGKRITYINQ